MAYVIEKASRHYAVIYEGTNPITGRERRRWHRCRSQADAEALAFRLRTQRTQQRQIGSLMALGDYLLGQWLPARESAIAETTYARYVTSVNHYLAREVYRNVDSMIAARDLYGAVGAPVSLIYGDHDWSRLSEREANLARLQGARSISLPDTGHFAALEQPTRVAEIMLDHSGG